MESRVRIEFVVAGGPRMPAQVDLYNADGEHCRADLYLDRVVVEYDGREERLKREKFAGDRGRQGDINDLSPHRSSPCRGHLSAADPNKTEITGSRAGGQAQRPVVPR